jgi:hypothetical protein
MEVIGHGVIDRTYENGQQYADDDKLPVKFEVRAVKHEFKSQEAGRPVFYDQEFISIIIPGSREVSTFMMDDTYRRRFAKAYERWKAAEGDQQKIDGTLLSELTWMSKSQIAELNYSNVYTVEQLANLPDVLARGFMGAQQLKDRAKRYLEAAAGEAPMLKMQAELEQRDQKIASLTDQIDKMNARIEELSKKR